MARWASVNMETPVAKIGGPRDVATLTLWSASHVPGHGTRRIKDLALIHVKMTTFNSSIFDSL
jgi:hypothetical protein